MAHKMRKVKGESIKTEAPARIMPSFNLTVSDLPEIKNWQVGKTYKLQLEVEQVSASKDEYGFGDKELSARFRIKKVKDVTDKSVWDMSKKEFEKMTVKAKRGGR